MGRCGRQPATYGDTVAEPHRWEIRRFPPDYPERSEGAYSAVAGRGVGVTFYIILIITTRGEMSKNIDRREHSTPEFTQSEAEATKPRVL